MSVHLTVWKHPSSYFGYEPTGHIIAATKHRESSILDESNYDVTSRRLLKLSCYSDMPRLEDQAKDGPFSQFDPDMTPLLYTWRASCSLVGWIEYLMIRPCQAARPLIRKMRKIVEELDGYPILDEMEYSDRQCEAIGEYWEHEPIKDRIEYCREANESIFAARQSSPPDRVYDRLSEMFA